MKNLDRVLRALFVAAAVGFGWGIRGHYGHLIGAMFPGAMLGLAFAYVSGHRNMYRWAPLLGAVGGLTIAIGGNMSYGILHGYAQAADPAPWYNYGYGLLALFLQGGSWGVFGTAAIGLLLEKKRIRLMEFCHLVATIFLTGWVFYFVVVDLLGFHVNPPRSDDMIGHLGGAIGLCVWLYRNKRIYALRGAVIGFVAFGIGMSLGRVAANLLTTIQFPNNNWNVMEILAGAIPGFVFTYYMIGIKPDEMPTDEHYPQLSWLSPVYILGMIPLLHLITRSDMPAIEEKLLTMMPQWGVAEASAMTALSVGLIYLTVALGFLLAVYWIYLYKKESRHSQWFGVLALGFIISFMDLFMRGYFFYPANPESYDMRTFSMMIYIGMILYVVVREVKYPHTFIESNEKECESISLKKWGMVAMVSIVLIVLMASVANSEHTMRSANTRFPLWSWKDGEYGKSEHNPDNSLAPAEKGIVIKRHN